MRRNKKSQNTWIFMITILAFLISFIFSLISELTLSKVNIFIGIIILILFITIGIIFDMIGVATTSASEKPFHAMGAKKIRGAKTAITFKKNADKVSSFCNDVIGDVCGIISGSIGVTITNQIASIYHLNIFWVGLIVTAIIASLTIGGKAISKSIAIKKSNEIVYLTAKIISLVNFEK